MLKQQKGVTLVALVITIIVLLILAGVSIAMLTGDNGILTKATSSRDESLKAEAKEQVSMAINTNMANKLDATPDADYGTEINAIDLQKTLTKQGSNATVVDGTAANEILVTYKASASAKRQVVVTVKPATSGTGYDISVAEPTDVE